jgi:hypothetical protein
MPRVSREIKNLQFVAQHTERVYLNEERTHDRFTLFHGAIATWVSKGTAKGGLSLKLGGFGPQAEIGSENQVTYDITDPMAQAMLLLTALQDNNTVKGLDDANVLEYVLVSGESCLRHPSVPSKRWHTDACMPTEELEERREDAELWHRPFNDHARVWLLMIQRSDGIGRAAGVLDQKWVNDGVIPRFLHRSWTTFGVLQDRVGDVPLIAPIAVFLDYPSKPG